MRECQTVSCEFESVRVCEYLSMCKCKSEIMGVSASALECEFVCGLSMSVSESVTVSACVRFARV